MSALQLVWFKRDLRTVDHRPLVEALKRGPVLPLYVVEPELWQQPDTSERQWLFCRESLLDLNKLSLIWVSRWLCAAVMW
jgi:deoxyribodipyrimidine photo-lyase